MPAKKPVKLKTLQGTSRPYRDAGKEAVELDLVSDVPDAPDWLPSTHAVKEWDRLAPLLYKVGLLTEPGKVVLAHLCAVHGKLVQLWLAGETPTASQIAQYRGLVNDFGLTPVSQEKVRSMTSNDVKSKFDEFD